MSQKVITRYDAAPELQSISKTGLSIHYTFNFLLHYIHYKAYSNL